MSEPEASRSSRRTSGTDREASRLKLAPGFAAGRYASCAHTGLYWQPAFRDLDRQRMPAYAIPAVDGAGGAQKAQQDRLVKTAKGTEPG
jgi:hypothetical protein